MRGLDVGDSPDNRPSTILSIMYLVFPDPAGPMMNRRPWNHLKAVVLRGSEAILPGLGEDRGRLSQLGLD